MHLSAADTVESVKHKLEQQTQVRPGVTDSLSVAAALNSLSLLAAPRCVECGVAAGGVMYEISQSHHTPDQQAPLGPMASDTCARLGCTHSSCHAPGVLEEQTAGAATQR